MLLKVLCWTLWDRSSLLLFQQQTVVYQFAPGSSHCQA